MKILIETLFAGTAEPLGNGRVQSCINKRPIAPPWRILRTGLAGDCQADLRHHGGPEKALHHYPRDHYAAWIEEDPELARALTHPGAFGENLSTFGIDENAICIGDVCAAGSALIQVSQGRQPCWKLNLRFGRKDMALRVQQSGRTGWYYRVLREGVIEPGSALELVERARPDWPLSRMAALLYGGGPGDPGELSEMASIPELSLSWRSLAARRITMERVEDSTARLDGPNRQQTEGVRRQSEGRAGFLGGHQPCRRRNTEDARSALAARKNCHANPKSNRAQKSRLHGCAWSEMVQGGAGRRAVHARLGQWTLSARVGRTKANTSRPPAVRLTVEPTGPRVLRKTRPGARPWRAALQ